MYIKGKNIKLCQNPGSLDNSALSSLADWFITIEGVCLSIELLPVVTAI